MLKILRRIYDYFFSTEIGVYSEFTDLKLRKNKKNDACFDIQSANDYYIEPNERVLVSTGIRFKLPYNFEAQIRSRSGLSYKSGLIVANTPGTIDADYRGEVKVILINLSKEQVCVKRGDRIAQVKFEKVPSIKLIDLDTIDTSTDRGEKGFGSSGK